MEISVKSNEVVVPKGQLLRYNQREEMKQDIEAMESMLPELKKQDKGAVSKRIARQKHDLYSQSPTELPGSAKDKLYKEAQALEASITQGMLSAEEMRKNPAGSVGRHMKWEKANKAKIMRWKNIKQMLEPTSEDPDLSNLETLRPTGTLDRFRGDAQINGMMNYRNIPQENWDMAFGGKGPENTALKQAERAHTEQQGKQTRNLTEAQRTAIGERLKAARAAKKAQQSEQDQPAPIIEGEPVAHEVA